MSPLLFYCIIRLSYNEISMSLSLSVDYVLIPDRYVYDHSWGTCVPRSSAGSVDVTVAQPCGYLGNIKVGGL